MSVLIKHPIYSNVILNEKVVEESNCKKCIHHKVCHHKVSTLCVNYLFGTSDADLNNCESCQHRYTRYCSTKKIPCFKCKHFTNIFKGV